MKGSPGRDASAVSGGYGKPLQAADGEAQRDLSELVQKALLSEQKPPRVQVAGAVHPALLVQAALLSEQMPRRLPRSIEV